MIFYATSLLTVSLLIGALWATVARDRALLRPEVRGRGRPDSACNRADIGGYIGLTMLVIVAPRVAAVGYLIIAIVLVLTA